MAQATVRSKQSKPPSRRRSAYLAAAAVLVAAGILAWRWVRPQTAPAETSSPDVLLITIDTLRADALGAYGNRRAATPWIDRLAAVGLRFDRAHASNVTTLPSHANILSGRYPTAHGVRDNSGFRFPRNVDTLATRLKAHGYRTGAFVSAFPLASQFGLNRGFDVYDDRFVDTQPRPVFLEQERSGRDTVARARRWLDQGPPGQPYFCWVHVYEPHFPYQPPEPFASRFARDPYLGEVAAADAALAPLIEPILDSTRRTLVVMTGDHGESLDEHGESTHGIFAYESTLRIPLIVFDRRRLTPRVVNEPVSHVDILPTVLEIIGIDVPEGLPGSSLLQVRPQRDEYFEALSGALNRGWAPLVGIVRGGFKYIDLPIPELYDLEHDPHETRNVASSDRGRVDAMRAALEPMLRSGGRLERRAETAETRERLRALGYASGGTAAIERRYTADDDPKRLIGLDRMLQETADRYLAGDLTGALARGRELLRLRPTMTIALLEVAEIERAAGRPGDAITTLRDALKSSPANPVALALLGACLTQTGRAAEAVEALRPYADRDDADLQVVITAALAMGAAGHHQDARALLAKARARNPDDAMLLVESGTVELMAGNRDGAQRQFRAALAMNPEIARAHSSLAVLAAEDGHREESLAEWRAAVARDSRESEKLLAFAQFARRTGGDSVAAPYFELFVETAPPDRFRRDIDQARDVLAHMRTR